MDEIMQLINQAGPIIEPAVEGIVMTVFGLLFARKNARINAIEEAKAQQFNAVLSEMLAEGKVSYMELYKCKNFLKIAKYADEMVRENKERVIVDEEYDIDWFIRFFDAVGNVSNEEMQKLWAKILAGEIESPNTFSLRTIGTVHNLSQKEAELFTKMTRLLLNEQEGMIFIMDTAHDFLVDVNELFGLYHDDILLLQDCGLLGSVQRNVRIDLNKQPAGLWNDSQLLKIRFNREDDVISLTYKYDAYPLTSVARQILPLVKQPSDDAYLMRIKEEIAARYSSNLKTSIETFDTSFA